MSAPSDRAIEEILGSSTQVTRRCEIYESDATTIWKLDALILDGAVDVSNSRDERRTLELTLDNSDGSLRHHPGGFYYDKVIKVFRGVEWDGGYWETQLGEFMIDTIESYHLPHTVHITGRDYAVKLISSEFTRATAFTAGQDLTRIVQSIAANAGITKVRFPASTYTLDKDFYFEPESSRWGAIKGLAEAFGMEIFFDPYGYLVMQPYNDPALAPEVFTFETGASGTLAKYTKKSGSSRIKNHVVVRGDGDDPNIFGEAVVQSTSPLAPGKIGDRLHSLSSAFYTSAAQCQTVADRLLPVLALEEYEINFEGIVLPWLDVGQVIRFADPNPDPADPPRFLLTDLNIPLGLGGMTSTSKRVSLIIPVTPVPTPGGPGSPGTVGYSLGMGAGQMLANISEEASVLDVNFVKSQGAKWIRFTMDWSIVESTENARNWSTYDRLIAAARNKDLSVLVVAEGAPYWANNAYPSNYPPTPAYFGAFANYCAGLADRGANVIEVWPGANLWSGGASATAYADLVKQVSSAVANVAPNTSVISGGLDPTGTGAGKPNTFLGSCMAVSGFTSAIDAVGVKWYSLGSDSPKVEGKSQISDIWTQIGGASPPIWVTEYGSPAGGDDAWVDTDASQAQRLLDYHQAIAELKSSSVYVDKMFFYSIRDSGADSWETSQHYGQLRYDRTERQIAATYRGITAQVI